MRAIITPSRIKTQLAPDHPSASAAQLPQGFQFLVGFGRRAFKEISPFISSDFPSPGSYLLYARNDSATWNSNFKIYKATVIPHLTLLQAATPEGPWTPTSARFTQLPGELFQSETIVSPSASGAFYYLKLAGQQGTLRIESSEKSGSKFRVTFSFFKP